MPDFTSSKWWQPENPKNSVAGILHRDPDKGWILRLDMRFDAPSNGPEDDLAPIHLTSARDSLYPMLLGVTEGGKGITLFDCQFSGSSVNAWGHESLSLKPEILVYGVHFDSVEDFVLSSLAIHYSNLDAWAATSGFSVTASQPGFFPMEMRYAKPDALEAEIEPGLSLRLQFSIEGPRLPAESELHMVQKAWLQVRTTKHRPYDELLRILSRLSDFVSLAVGQPMRPLEIHATCDARTGKGDETRIALLHIVTNRKPVAPVLPDVDSRKMLFTAKEIKDRFSELLLRWFEENRDIEPLYTLYFGTARSPGMYVEHRFVNMFHALESYDRRTRKLSPNKQLKHESRLDSIYQAVKANEREWLEGRLRNSHEPAAADRIRFLVKEVGAEWLLDDKAISLAGDLRNYVTHYSPNIESRLPAKEERSRCMHNLSVRLRVLCELILMRWLGLPASWAKERVEKSSRLERWLAN